MTQLPPVHTCANPDCKTSFTSLGEGKLSACPVDNPESWGLPADTKQKVVWLCRRCSSSLYVRADHHRDAIELVRKARGAVA
jgi:hypothetical protein